MWLSILLFLAAGVLEIGGGALVWRWWLPTYQTPHFSRVYAAYGGVFIEPRGRIRGFDAVLVARNFRCAGAGRVL